MEEAIKNLAAQFAFKPIVGNEANFKPAESFVVGGMGGSHLAADLLKKYNPGLDLHVHTGYGLPLLTEKRYKKSLFIASSYSGNTEETLSFAEKAFEAKYNLAVIATGGALIDFAKKNNLPYIELPATGIQPRSAIGFSLIALALLVGDSEILVEIQALAMSFDPMSTKPAGEKLASELKGKIPVIYSSRLNEAIAYNWKIKFNETAKIPAFYNVVPELNHNEMNGFDVTANTKELCDRFHFIFIEDADDHPRLTRRLEVLFKLYTDRGLPVNIVELSGASVLEKIFTTLTLADWTALTLAHMYGTEPEQVPMVEEFKKLIV